MLNNTLYVMLNLIQHLINGEMKTKVSCATTDEILSQAQNDNTGVSC